jgi:hypothetical protein
MNLSYADSLCCKNVRTSGFPLKYADGWKQNGLRTPCNSFTRPSKHVATKKRIITLKEKINVVEFFEKQKDSVRALAGKFQIGQTQAANIICKTDEFYRSRIPKSTSQKKEAF